MKVQDGVRNAQELRRSMALHYVYTQGELVRLAVAHSLLGVGLALVLGAGLMVGLLPTLALAVPGAALVAAMLVWAFRTYGRQEDRLVDEQDLGRSRRRRRRQGSRRKEVEA